VRAVPEQRPASLCRRSADYPQYEAKDGSGKRYRTEIVARQLRLLGNRANTPPKAEASDDIPF
jgi:single-stranded DNA-binding protein